MIEYEYVEIPIGTKIITQDIRGKKIKAICKEGNANNCSSCIFCESETCGKIFCQPHVRSDKNHVYFKQIDETDNTKFLYGGGSKIRY